MKHDWWQILRKQKSHNDKHIETQILEHTKTRLTVNSRAHRKPYTKHNLHSQKKANIQWNTIGGKF